MFDIFTEVFTRGGTDPKGASRLVRVMASQAANPWLTNEVLAFEDAHRKTDALAIAPYFGSVPTLNGEGRKGLAAWKNADWNDRIAFVEEDLRLAMARMDAHKAILDETLGPDGKPIYAHIELFAYEGGQHYVGAPDTHVDTEFTELMQELSRRPEMRDFYRRYLEHWDAIGGRDFMLFASMSTQSKWGSWGLVVREGQTLEETPKLLGVLDYLAAVERRAEEQETPPR